MKKISRHIARITLLAFLCNVFLPFFAVYDIASHQAFAKEMSSLFGEKLLICTGDGFKWVKWDDLPQGKEKHAPSYQCALCYLAAHSLKDVTLPTGTTLSHANGKESRTLFYDYRPAAFYLQSSLHSRAPPTSFSS